MSGKHGNRFVEPAEGDDLAARLDRKADEEGRQAAKCRPLSERANIGFARAAAFREAAEMAHNYQRTGDRYCLGAAEAFQSAAEKFRGEGEAS